MLYVDLNPVVLAGAVLFAAFVASLLVARVVRRAPSVCVADAKAPAARRDAPAPAFTRENLDELLGVQLCASWRAREPLSLLLVDVDNFAGLWRQHGRDEMDRALAHISKALARTVRKSDLVCRYGGATFAIIMPAADAKEAALFGERIRAEIPRACRNVVMKDARVSVTVGVASAPAAGDSAAELFDLAVARLNDGRRAGRDRVVAGSEGHLETLCIRVAG